ncbi:MAG: PQQ-like beta-propeller repeat protein [Opitutaceae bacterium]|nr:PQQ-like beta-propeller repeat protein [Opitutaceae bacterium]
MHNHSSPVPALPRPLRLWPGVALALAQVALWVAGPLVFPTDGIVVLLGGAGCGLLIGLWWLFFSRAPWLDRLGAITFAVLLVIVARPLIHPSIGNGMMGLMLAFFATPALGVALVAAAVVTRGRSAGARRATIAVALVAAVSVFGTLRTAGLSGSGQADLHWRWTPTAEEHLLAQTRTQPKPPPAPAAATAARADWPGFRGAQRDSIVRGSRLAADWAASPPVELWRRPVGPGWSSFAVAGDFFYTQEQRGEDEVVSCYQLGTGAPVWSHTDRTRFWESNAGAGPRGTPTLAHGRIYAMGATGILNALDARTGAPVWSRPVATELARKVPDWGFACSPLVFGDTVIIAAGGLLAAYDAGSGAPRWTGPKGGWGYSSPHLATLHGVAHVVLLNGAGAIAVAPADGRPLWTHAWKNDGITQPALLPDGDLLLGSGSGLGAKVGVLRLAVAKPADTWIVEERWTSPAVKPYFNDFVVHAGHVYGFDKNDLACIALADGARQWKGGRYGHGQVIVLADQDLLLVLAENGDLALARATPDQFTELARLPAIKGKTWNHPALAGDILLVRNSEEMAAFRLSTATR